MLKSISKLFGGNVAVQAFALGMMPLVTRIYSPESFGRYQYLVSVCLILSPLVQLGLVEALVKVKGDSEYWSSLIGAIRVFFINALGFTVVYYIPSLMYFPLSLLETVFIFTILFSTSVYAVSKTYFLRVSQYGRHALQSGVQAVSGNLMKILVGFALPVHYSLLGAVFFGNLIGIFYSIRSSSILIYLNDPKFRYLSYKSLFQRSKFFATYLTGSNLMSVFLNWHVIALAPLFGNLKEVGFVGLALTVVKTPSHPFLMSLVNYSYSEVSKAKFDFMETKRFYLKIFLLGVVITLPAFLILSLYSQLIFSFVFGAQWAESGSYAVFLAFPLIFAFPLVPIYRSLANYHDRQKILFFIDLASVAIIFLIVIIFLFYEISLLHFVLSGSVLLVASHLIKFSCITFSVRAKF